MSLSFGIIYLSIYLSAHAYVTIYYFHSKNLSDCRGESACIFFLHFHLMSLSFGIKWQCLELLCITVIYQQSAHTTYTVSVTLYQIQDVIVFLSNRVCIEQSLTIKILSHLSYFILGVTVVLQSWQWHRLSSYANVTVVHVCHWTHWHLSAHTQCKISVTLNRIQDVVIVFEMVSDKVFATMAVMDINETSFYHIVTL